MYVLCKSLTEREKRCARTTVQQKKLDHEDNEFVCRETDMMHSSTNTSLLPTCNPFSSRLPTPAGGRQQKQRKSLRRLLGLGEGRPKDG